VPTPTHSPSSARSIPPGRPGDHLEGLDDLVSGFAPLPGPARPVDGVCAFRDRALGADGAGGFVHGGAVVGPEGGLGGVAGGGCEVEGVEDFSAGAPRLVAQVLAVLLEGRRRRSRCREGRRGCGGDRAPGRPGARSRPGRRG
jgi:hypothetical protein